MNIHFLIWNIWSMYENCEDGNTNMMNTGIAVKIKACCRINGPEKTAQFAYLLTLTYFNVLILHIWQTQRTHNEVTYLFVFL